MRWWKQLPWKSELRLEPSGSALHEIMTETLPAGFVVLYSVSVINKLENHNTY
jgi:hypothetical protein